MVALCCSLCGVCCILFVVCVWCCLLLLSLFDVLLSVVWCRCFCLSFNVDCRCGVPLLFVVVCFCFVVCGCCWLSFLLIVGVSRCLLLVVIVEVCSYVLRVVVVVGCCLLLVDGCRCGLLFAVVVASDAVVFVYLLVLFVVAVACLRFVC